jgi:hypothetical protein
MLGVGMQAEGQMSFLVQVKSLNNRPVEFRLSLDLPGKPTEAGETNSTWQDKDLGYLRYSQGYCIASKNKAAYPDTLFLWHLTPPEGDLHDLRVPKAARLMVVTLLGFFGSDGGIREKGSGVVNPKATTTTRLSEIEWSIESPQHYPKSVAGSLAW